MTGNLAAHAREATMPIVASCGNFWNFVVFFFFITPHPFNPHTTLLLLEQGHNMEYKYRMNQL